MNDSASGFASPGSRRLTNHPLLGVAPEAPLARVVVDGRELRGFAGEPLAALLLAHGVGVLRSMPGSGAPRGLFCGVGRCADCLMTVDGELNVRACVTAVRDGMQAQTQHGLGAWEAEN
jgi:predicted molibdopterin-dependent oxidoreductase YjgC